jgi:molybdopterin/thiamine biosynthesis adenylyltransferase
MKSEIFKFPDTNSSRAGISDLNSKFEGQKIAIIGLGGTGSYILDLISKTNISEIHLYDGDDFQVHNAFRAPGGCGTDAFGTDSNVMKVDYYSEVYSRMRNGIVKHPIYVDENNINEFSVYDFVFISVDSNAVRSFITKALLKLKVSFIDVGMGVTRNQSELLGTIRVTVGTPENNSHLQHRIGSDEMIENEYATNIQIVELNCLNATLAVIRWKKMIGFYQDLKGEFNNLYFINTGKTLNEDFTEL